MKTGGLGPGIQTAPDENLAKRDRGRRPGSKNKRPPITKDVRLAARRLVENPAYRKALKKRLVEGTAGPMENLLWLYAYGKPREGVDDTEREKLVASARQRAIEAIKALPPPQLHRLPLPREQWPGAIPVEAEVVVTQPD